MLSIDTKAMNIIFCALNYQGTCKETNQVKESKINMLVHQCELLKMLLIKSITKHVYKNNYHY
ncbi:hypothetical protein NC653_039250 [Populus alba x Populus x berolinensis]|uniref:Uncharacterized protein n=1 Tax=Populus alba x Populus x berolinensis TaxID=444605 RepID=A0AAD6LAR1_9ROSI|nr:hypothetical protein NC653_039250 [Populus alba x Populus x berolinensis]